MTCGKVVTSLKSLVSCGGFVLTLYTRYRAPVSTCSSAEANTTTTTSSSTGTPVSTTQSAGLNKNSHSGELQRWSPSSLEHPVHEHPVFTEAPQIELPRASAVFSGGENLQMPPGDEARVGHAHVHRALRRVPADSHRPLLHQVFEFSALQPGYRRPRHPAYHRHLQGVW